MKPRFAALVAVACLVPACGDGGDGGNDALAVSFLSPANNSGGVPRQPVVYIRFNRPLDPATVTQGNVVLLDAMSANLPRAVSYAGALNEIRVVPTSALSKSAVYQVSLTNGLKDAEGNAYPGGFFQFTVGTSDDADRPSFAGAATAGNPTTNSIQLTWAAATDATSGVVYDVFLSTSSGTQDLTDPFLAGSSSPTGVTVTGLSPATTYFFVVRARDAFGNTDLNTAERSATTLP